jgi:hypothetical protein
MKRLDKYKLTEKFLSDENETFAFSFTNSTNGGFHEGILLHFYEQEWAKEISVMLDDSEVRRMRDFLLKLYPITDKQFTK